MLTWNQEIVSAFRQPELSAVPQGFLAENFEKQIELMESLSAKISSMGEVEAEQEVHRVFIDGLVYEARTGIYSNHKGFPAHGWVHREGHNLLPRLHNQPPLPSQPPPSPPLHSQQGLLLPSTVPILSRFQNGCTVGKVARSTPTSCVARSNFHCTQSTLL